jgi:poly(A) polymerase
MNNTPQSANRCLAFSVVRRLQDAGFEAYWVGGCVRDQLLGREPGDHDIATNARPETIESLFPRTIAVGRKFGVMVVVEGVEQIQVATYRAESEYGDGRHPSRVEFGDPKADAMRRDFTINGLFYDPVRGTLRDWVGGEADVRARVIRTIGPPKVRFAEDHLRLLRAVRFAAQLGFQIEAATFAAIRALAPQIKTVSAERVRDELMKIFKPGHVETGYIPGGVEPLAPLTNGGVAVSVIAARGLDLLHRSGLLAELLPELEACVTCEQSPDYHPEGTVYNHLVLMLQQLESRADPLLPWCVLLHDVAKPKTAERDPETGIIHFYGHERIGAEMAREIMVRLRFPKKEIEDVSTVVRHHMQFKDAPQMRKATLRRMLLRPTFPLELELHRLDCLGSHARLDIHDFLRAQFDLLANLPEILPPLLTGDDLIALGIKPGPSMGALLSELRDLQLAEELSTRETAMDWVRQRLREET